VLQHAVSDLIWELRNRRGDLNLAAVAPLIEGLPDPAAGWEAVVGYIHSVPQLRMQVQTVTYSRLEFDREAPNLFAPVQLHEVRLPPSVLGMFGLPPYGRAQEVPGVWRRAAFGAQVQPRNWSYLTVDFESRQRGLDTETPAMRALAEHLGGLGNAWSNVEVWIEGGGARRGSSAGMDRATSVRQHLVGLVGDRNPVITWHEPTNRGTRASAAAAPPESNDRRQQVMIWWTVTPLPSPLDDAMSEMAFGEDPDPDEAAAPAGRRSG
jgi:hypothetical protein